MVSRMYQTREKVSSVITTVFYRNGQSREKLAITLVKFYVCSQKIYDTRSGYMSMGWSVL